MSGKQCGFTLIEVLLAIMIGSLVLTSVYGIFTSVSNARNRLEAEGESYHHVRIFFDRVGGELRSLRAAAVRQQPVLKSGKTLEGEPYLEFSTELASPVLKQRGGLSRVRYELRRADEAAAIYRSEQALLADLAASEALPFVEGVKHFEVRYKNTNADQWQDNWSGGRPPKTVEINLEVEIEGRVAPFRSSFVLPDISP